MTDAGWAEREDVKEAGFYWLIWAGKEPQIVQVRGTSVHFTSGLTMSLEEVDGQFLGPISPDTYHQGRVAGLRDAEQLCGILIEHYKGCTSQNRQEKCIALVGMMASITDQIALIEQQAQGGR